MLVSWMKRPRGESWEDMLIRQASLHGKAEEVKKLYAEEIANGFSPMKSAIFAAYRAKLPQIVDSFSDN